MLVAMLCLYGVASAQDVHIVDSVFFRSEYSGDQGLFLAFGVGSEYTDSTDPGTRDREVFGPPPSGFFGLFLRQCEYPFGGECYYGADFRAVPPDVAIGEEEQFMLLYKVSIQKGVGRKIIIDFPREFAVGIDSINMRDLLTGTIYNHTFTSGVSEDTVQNDGINQLEIRVYYNLGNTEPSAVSMTDGSGSRALLMPNPVRGGTRIVYAGELPVGARLVLYDRLGRRVTEGVMVSHGTGGTFTAPDVPFGLYLCTIITDAGEELYHQKLMVMP
jgi:hypothetical protein